MTIQGKTKRRPAVKQAVKIVARTVKAPAVINRKLETFRKLLIKNLVPTAKVENVVETIVDAALVSEYTNKIRQRSYYRCMQSTIANALLKNKILKQDAISISKHYQKLLG
ncbi:hypothetical protein NO2_1261 [Candidatus Termititenax persephonae]|uniref:Uncharacterized protein n=1 Tax=Candidatus Termititenax persephonae TaxID=2218525 RepID=A0A388TIW9_9BACT|nr:hypothetical protein NO2_1261 [Candidatus Termititenax persephonae]